MRILSKARRDGKTYSVVELFMKDIHAVLVVFSRIEKLRIIKDYKISNKEKQQRIVHHTDALRGLQISEIYIDNLDMVLQGLFRHPITLATLTEY